jgi:hypothetical protein
VKGAREDELALLARVGAELVRLGAHKTAAIARRYYADVRAGRRARDPWDAAHVVRLAQDLRVPPHDHDLPVRSFGACCACATPKTYTAGIFPGGSRHACDGCREEWLVLDGPGRRVSDGRP